MTRATTLTRSHDPLGLLSSDNSHNTRKSSAPSRPPGGLGSQPTIRGADGGISEGVDGDDAERLTVNNLVKLLQRNRAGFVRTLESLSKEDGYAGITDVAEILTVTGEDVDEAVATLNDIACDLGYGEMMCHDKELWDSVRTRASHHRTDASRKAEAIATLHRTWPSHDVRRDFADLFDRRVGSHTWRQLATLCRAAERRGLEYGQFKMTILWAQCRRLTVRRKGTSPALQMEGADFSRAAELVSWTAEKIRSVRREISKNGFGVTAQGFITRADTVDDVGWSAAYGNNVEEDDGHSPLDATSQGVLSLDRPNSLEADDCRASSQGFVAESCSLGNLLLSVDQKTSQSPRRSGGDGSGGNDGSGDTADPADITEQDSIEGDLVNEEGKEERNDREHDGEHDADDDGDKDSDAEDGEEEKEFDSEDGFSEYEPEDTVSLGKRGRHDDFTDHGDSDDSVGPGGEDGDDDATGRLYSRRASKRVRMSKCGCGPSVSNTFLQSLKGVTKLSTVEQVVLVKGWNKFRSRRLCYNHTRRVSAALGLKSKGLSHAGVHERIGQVYDAVANGTLGKLKTDLETYKIFRRTHRPPRPADKLGTFKYLHHQTPIVLTDADQARLASELGIDRDRWHRDGTLALPAFDWWRDLSLAADPRFADCPEKTVFAVVEAEFAMYAHHLREVNGKPNYGWLRNMYHSLGQQAMRQDPLYWLLYCVLRGDRNHCLVSYPYYAKSQRLGDSTYFRHIDVNVPGLLATGRGGFQIQGSLSLDDEEVDDCTEVLPGMHRHFQEWAADLVTRGRKLECAIHSITDQDFTRQDAIKYSTDWTPVPCTRLQVRITQPHLPHGAQIARRQRRTLLPWFVGLQPDLHTLEIAEAGSVDDLAKAHRNLELAPRSPSGLPNRHGDAPYAFPAAVPLRSEFALPNALIGQARHDNARVVAEKRTMLLGTRAQRDAYLATFRQHMAESVVRLFQTVKQAEREAFGERSYWHRQECGLHEAPLEYDPDPSGDESDEGSAAESDQEEDRDETSQYEDAVSG